MGQAHTIFALLGQVAGQATGNGSVSDRATGGGLGPVWVGIVVLLAAGCLAGLWVRDVIRPGSMARLKARGATGGLGPLAPVGPAEPAVAVQWLMLGLGLYMLQLVAMTLAMAVFGVTGPSTDAGALRPGVLAGLSAYAVSGAAGLAALGFMAGRGAIAGSGPSGLVRAGMVGVGGLVVMVPILLGGSMGAVWLAGLIAGSPPDPIAHGTLRVIVQSTDPWKWGLIATAVLGAPVIEEVVYRGCLQSAVTRATGSAWVGVVLVSGLFAVVHLGGSAAVPWHALVPLFVLGVGLGILTARTGRILPAIVAHAGFNALNVAVAMWGAGGGA